MCFLENFPSTRYIATYKLALLTKEYIYRTAFWYVGLVNTINKSLSPHDFNLDIVKVRLQTSSQYKSALDGATQIFKNEGPLAFYKVPGLDRTQDYKIFTDDLQGYINPTGWDRSLCKSLAC